MRANLFRCSCTLHPLCIPKYSDLCLCTSQQKLLKQKEDPLSASGSLTNEVARRKELSSLLGEYLC